jgi:HK97 family phage portal protein
MPAKKPPAKRAPRAKAPASTQFEIRGLSDQMPWGVFIPPDQVTAEVAIRVTAILACVRFLAQSLASMPLSIMRTLPNGRKSIASDLPCYDVLTRRPNSWQSQYDYIETTVYHCALHGNAYSRIVPGAYGFCSSLEPLHPSRMQVMRMSDNSLGYSYLFPDGRWQKFSQAEICHFRWMSDNSYMGMIPAELCGTSVALARKLDVAAASFWDNSARPDVILETQETIPDPAVRELRRQWSEMYGGARKRGSTAILPKKVQAKILESNSNEASQFMELRASIVTEVARAFGVPSTLIGDAGMARWSNVEQEFLTAQVFCLLPWQKRIEGTIERSILNTYGTDVYAKIDNRGLLRGDTAARVALYQSMFNMGALSPNELRDLEDFPLIDKPEADETYMQLGFAPLRPVPAEPAKTDPNGSPLDGLVLQDTALNGAQVSSLLEILASISAGTLDKASAISLITSSYPAITEADAKDIVAGALAAPPQPKRAAMPYQADEFNLQAPAADAAADGGPDDSSSGPDLSAMDQDSSAMGQDCDSSSSGIALDGEQLEALICILDKVSGGTLTKDAGVATLLAAFPAMTPDQAEAIVGGVMPSTVPVEKEVS